VIAIVDAGPLYAAADQTDRFPPRVGADTVVVHVPIYGPVLTAAEATYLVGRNLGLLAEAAFVEGLADFEIVPPSGADWSRIAELIRTYGSLPLGAADASVIALAERLDTDVVVTFDRRHFTVVWPRHVPAFSLLLTLIRRVSSDLDAPTPSKKL
jgi:predicted nucleic acid-binding protein